MLTLLRLVITAAKRYHKKTTLTDLDVELAVLQNQIRLTKDLACQPINKYQHWSGLNLETVRVIGGCDAVCLTFRAGQIDELLI